MFQSKNSGSRYFYDLTLENSVAFGIGLLFGFSGVRLSTII